MTRGNWLIAAVLLWITVAFAQSCGPNHPCAQGCCSNSGYCGFGPSYCGQGNCTSNCDATAQCGQYAPAGKQKCPLNVCCSQYGYCGTTSDFCGAGCQNGCGAPLQPSCPYIAGSGRKRIGYYESWAYNRPCDGYIPEQITVGAYTHINYAFALIGSDGRIAPMNSFDAQLYTRVTGLKQDSPGLQVFISVGGWAAGGQVFSNMAATASSRAIFITSAVQFMRTYGFDGIDIDWEYPAAGDRGGVSADTQNYVLLLKELRAALGKQGLTATIPASYWYLQGYDVVSMQPYVDWFNIMTYDIHGTWDGTSPYTQAIVQPHTNLTEITQGLNLLWRNLINPGKVVLGLAFYGRSFTLKDPSCTSPGCAFTGGGNQGECTQQSGFLSNAEIARIIQKNNIKPTFDTTAAVKYFSWGSGQWVSYDDLDTIGMKNDYADKLCLGGTMIWAIDLGDPTNDDSEFNLIARNMAKIDGPQALSNKRAAVDKYTAIQKQKSPGLYTYWTNCSLTPTCSPGFSPWTSGSGRLYAPGDPNSARDSHECAGAGIGYTRALCVEDDIRGFDCKWYGTAKSCSQTCPKNTILLALNSNPRGAQSSCMFNKYAAYCCSSIETSDIRSCANTLFEEFWSLGFSPRFFDNGSQTDYGYGTPLECKFEDPFFNAYLSDSIHAGLQIVPGNWPQQAGMGVINFKQPFQIGNYPVGVTTQQTGGCITTSTIRSEKDILGLLTTTTCNYGLYPQACQHYSSVNRVNPQYSTLICPRQDYKLPRVAPGEYNDQHNPAWNQWIPLNPLPNLLNKAKHNKCERDEWPPNRFRTTSVTLSAWIRRLPASENGGAGNLWRGACDGVSSTTTTKTGATTGLTCYETETVSYILPRFAMSFVNMPSDPNDGILSNWCQLTSTFSYDPGYALLTYDPWYNGRTASTSNYLRPPASAMLVGQQPPRATNNFAKRLAALSVDDFVLDDGNSSTPISAEELWDATGIRLCESADCEAEMKELGIEPQSAVDSAPVISPPAPTHAEQIIALSMTAVPAATAIAPIMSMVTQTRAYLS